MGRPSSRARTPGNAAQPHINQGLSSQNLRQMKILSSHRMLGSTFVAFDARNDDVRYMHTCECEEIFRTAA